jgi:hypothetical protein
MHALVEEAPWGLHNGGDLKIGRTNNHLPMVGSLYQKEALTRVMVVADQCLL